MDMLQRVPGGETGIAKRTVKDQISDKLAYMIHSGLLRPGDELPSERELASTLGVSRETVRSAIAVLQARQMIEVSQGSRTRVLGRGPVPLHEPVSTPHTPLSTVFGHSCKGFGSLSMARDTTIPPIPRSVATPASGPGSEPSIATALTPLVSCVGEIRIPLQHTAASSKELIHERRAQAAAH